MIMRQYFPQLIDRFNLLTDARHQSYVECEMKVIFIVRLVGLLIAMKSMHEMTRVLNTEKAIEDIANICKVKIQEIPHCDTMNNVFEKIKANYPRLKILISGDALYANKPVLDICKENGWKYTIRFKEKSIPTLYKEFNIVTREVKDGNESNEENR